MARKWTGQETLVDAVNSIDLYGADVPLPGVPWKIVDFASLGAIDYKLVVEVETGLFVEVRKSAHDGLQAVRNAVQVELAKKLITRDKSGLTH